jgi:hypothetical protein
VYVGGFHGASSRRSHRGSCCSLGTRLGDVKGTAALAFFFLGDSFLDGVVATKFVVGDRQGDVPAGKNGNQYSCGWRIGSSPRQHLGELKADLLAVDGGLVGDDARTDGDLSLADVIRLLYLVLVCSLSGLKCLCIRTKKSSHKSSRLGRTKDIPRESELMQASGFKEQQTSRTYFKHLGDSTLPTVSIIRPARSSSKKLHVRHAVGNSRASESSHDKSCSVSANRKERFLDWHSLQIESKRSF